MWEKNVFNFVESLTSIAVEGHEYGSDVCGSVPQDTRVL